MKTTTRGKTAILCNLVIAFAMSAFAEDMTLVGGSDVAWGANSTIWTNTVTGGRTHRFHDYDNGLVSSEYFTGSTLTLGANFNPASISFDINRPLNLVYSSGSFTNAAMSFTKMGSGTLFVSGSKANTATGGVEVVGGELAANDVNRNSLFGPSGTPFWVNVRSGASLTFLGRNNTGTSSSSDVGIRIQLDKGARLNISTNLVNSSDKDPDDKAVRSPLALNTLKLNGGSIAVGANARTSYNNPNTDVPFLLGGNTSLYIFNKIHFSGDTVQTLGCGKNGLSDFTDNNHLISLNVRHPVEICVDEIGNGDDADAQISMAAFTWGTNSLGFYRADLVKTGLGTLSIPNASCSQFTYYEKFPEYTVTNTVKSYFLGDFTVQEGTVDFSTNAVFFFHATGSDSVQNVTVSTNGTLIFRKRNMAGSAGGGDKVRLVVDHGTFKYVTGAGDHGPLTINDIVLDDPILDVRNTGMGRQGKISTGGYYYTYGIFYVKNSMVFRGTRPLVMEPDPTVDVSGWESSQAVNLFNTVQNDLRASGREEDLKGTVFDVADMTGDGNVDVTMGYHLWNGFTTNERDAAITDSGLIKTGAGTLSVASVTNKVSGAVTVAEGTMRVDGKLVTPSVVDVYSGAFIGGTGTVARVSMDAGAGFDAPAGQDKPLTVQGDLALPATGVVNISNLDGSEEKDMKPVNLVTATGDITGAENLAGWTVKVNGVTTRKWRLAVRNGVIGAKFNNGFVITFR